LSDYLAARRLAGTLVLAAFASAPLAAQSSGRGLPPSQDDPQNPFSIDAAAARDRQQADRAAAQSRAAALNQDARFRKALADFVSSWNELLKTCGPGKWNAKRARAARKAFERLIRSKAWIEQNGE